jgi:hypothetical protein
MIPIAVSSFRHDECGVHSGEPIFFRPVSNEPEYLICMNCETPTYQFEYENGKLVSVLCAACGNEDPSEFTTETEMEEES